MHLIAFLGRFAEIFCTYLVRFFPDKCSVSWSQSPYTHTFTCDLIFLMVIRFFYLPKLGHCGCLPTAAHEAAVGHGPGTQTPSCPPGSQRARITPPTLNFTTARSQGARITPPTLKFTTAGSQGARFAHSTLNSTTAGSQGARFAPPTLKFTTAGSQGARITPSTFNSTTAGSQRVRFTPPNPLNFF